MGLLFKLGIGEFQGNVHLFAMMEFRKVQIPV
jgi:hypothetical protein